MFPTSLGIINLSIFPSISWSRAETGVSLAVRTVSQSTCRQYLFKKKFFLKIFTLGEAVWNVHTFQNFIQQLS